MTTLSAFAFPFMNTFCLAQFTSIDALRRAQGEALDLLGFCPNECDYHVILSGAHWRLRKYAHHDAQSSLLIVPAPIKRPYIWDLAPSISAVRHCLDRHFGVYLLEWMPPLDNGKQAGLADYADYAISECVAKVSHESQGSRPFLMGHSLGGTLAAIFCALEQKSVRGLVLLGAPLCFAPGSSQFRDALVSLFPRMLPEAEIVPGSLLSQVSALASPDAFVWARLRDAIHSIADPAAMDVHVRVERWALDEVPLPGPLVSEIVQLLYRENRFCRGTLTIRKRCLGPSRVHVPVLAIVNTADEIAPLNSVKHFLDEMPAKETRIIEYPGEAGVGLQHLAMLVGPQARARIWPEIFSWLKTRN
jgi:polyhydroxyalkanoate synthase